eukprot:1153975-Pelagomonas_calceolata.AAC.2
MARQPARMAGAKHKIKHTLIAERGKPVNKQEEMRNGFRSPTLLRNPSKCQEIPLANPLLIPTQQSQHESACGLLLSAISIPGNPTGWYTAVHNCHCHPSKLATMHPPLKLVLELRNSPLWNVVWREYAIELDDELRPKAKAKAEAPTHNNNVSPLQTGLIQGKSSPLHMFYFCKVAMHLALYLHMFHLCNLTLDTGRGLSTA